MHWWLQEVVQEVVFESEEEVERIDNESDIRYNDVVKDVIDKGLVNFSLKVESLYFTELNTIGTCLYKNRIHCSVLKLVNLGY